MSDGPLKAHVNSHARYRLADVEIITRAHINPDLTFALDGANYTHHYCHNSRHFTPVGAGIAQTIPNRITHRDSTTPCSKEQKKINNTVQKARRNKTRLSHFLSLDIESVPTQSVRDTAAIFRSLITSLSISPGPRPDQERSRVDETRGGKRES